MWYANCIAHHPLKALVQYKQSLWEEEERGRMCRGSILTSYKINVTNVHVRSWHGRPGGQDGWMELLRVNACGCLPD